MVEKQVKRPRAAVRTELRGNLDLPSETSVPSRLQGEPSKAEQDELLTEALKESFPASDPISSLRFTSP